MKIDAHQHFWKLDRGDYDWLTPDLAPIFRDFLPDDLAPLLKANGVDGTIVVQAAETEAETEYLLSLTDQYDWILGVVGWVDMEAPHAVQSIERLAQHSRLVGLRPMIQSIPEDDWMLKREILPAIEAMQAHNLTFDALVLPKHLVHLKTFLERHPNLTTVVDHCAKPEIRNNLFQPWADEIAVIAAFSNVFCKISGLATEASHDWDITDLAPYIHHVQTMFGPDRTMFGSDWPVVNLASDYSQWNSAFESVLADISQTDQRSFSARAAIKAYPRLREVKSS
ncbi:amidohydrolase family protein [Shimia sp.]|uniref:amidohydrolase family protein n=1 Tax=Shimia sp. TaxID=1954381 RepID=UPI0032975D82